MKRYRLTSRAQINGVLREAGYVFTLKDGEAGPHRTVVASNHGAQIADHLNAQNAVKDVPLYEEVAEPPALPSEREILQKEVTETEARLEELKERLGALDKPAMIEDHSGEQD